MTDKLQHIAFIMDGNGRWAKQKGLPRSLGHKKGTETLQNIVKAASDMGISYITLYAFSTENWKRDKAEVDYLMNLLREYLAHDIKEIIDKGARIKVIGERYMLDKDIVQKINELEQSSASNTKFTLCIALSYGSRLEILSAVKHISQSVKDGAIQIKDIDEKLFSDMLYTKDIPDPDLVIRTSGEQRLSNYLLWQIAYSEFYFTKTYWPDFTANELQQIIDDFNSRERRYGKA